MITSGCMEELPGQTPEVVQEPSVTVSTVAPYVKPSTLSFDPMSWDNQVIIEDYLLSPQNLICSPRDDDGSPSCGNVYTPNGSKVRDQEVITKNVCPTNEGEYVKIFELYSTLDDSTPPKGTMRSAYYCLSENRFWLFDYENQDQPEPFWYGPYEGYPVAEKTGSPPTTFVAPKTTTSTTTTTTSTTTTTYRYGNERWEPDTKSCDMEGSRFWRALCYDEFAYMLSNKSFCRTVYCKARFDGAKVCEDVPSDSLQWRAYRQKACEAWAERSPFVCDPIMKSEDCIKWYAMLAQDINLCGKADRGSNSCGALFSFWRGADEVCWNERSLTLRRECESMYHKMRGMDNVLIAECQKVKKVKDKKECIEATKGWISKMSELYAIDNELLEG